MDGVTKVANQWFVSLTSLDGRWNQPSQLSPWLYPRWLLYLRVSRHEDRGKKIRECRTHLSFVMVHRGKNIIHASDAVDSAEREIALWFPNGVKVRKCYCGILSVPINPLFLPELLFSHARFTLRID
jgi:hypothetical protein